MGAALLVASLVIFFAAIARGESDAGAQDGGAIADGVTVHAAKVASTVRIQVSGSVLPSAIVLEALGVTLSKRARARALQLPAWNEALGLPRPWDQQWSLRIQQVLAFESDLLEYGDIFDGSVVIEAKTAEVAEASWAELQDVLALGGAFEAIDELKSRLVGSQSERVRRIETGELQVVGVNCFQETAESPLATAGDGGGSILRVDPAVESQLKADVEAWRAARDGGAVQRALDDLRRAAEGTDNVMPATIALAVFIISCVFIFDHFYNCDCISCSFSFIGFVLF